MHERFDYASHQDFNKFLYVRFQQTGALFVCYLGTFRFGSKICAKADFVFVFLIQTRKPLVFIIFRLKSVFIYLL